MTGTLEEFAASLGVQVAAIERLDIGELTVYWAADPMSGESGWWWAVARSGSIFAMGWTAGTGRDRDEEIGQAIGKSLRDAAVARAALGRLPTGRLLS